MEGANTAEQKGKKEKKGKTDTVSKAL